MYVHICGIIKQSKPTFVVLDVQGIGYKIFITPSSFAKLPQLGEKVLLHTTFIIREQLQALYGFVTEAERDIFEKLLQVNGIGPKLALSLVGHMTIGDLQGAVAKGDVKSLSKVPGIGKKTAERLIVEMRGRLPESEGEVLSSIEQDIAATLVNLGYGSAQADQIAKKVSGGKTSGDLSAMIREALQLAK